MPKKSYIGQEGENQIWTLFSFLFTIKSWNHSAARTLETLDEWFMPCQWPNVHWELVLFDCYLPRRSPTKRPWLGWLLSHQKSPTKSPLTLKMLCPTFGKFLKLQTRHLQVNSYTPICSKKKLYFTKCGI